MLMKASTPRKVKNLSLENLESRLNLSRFSDAFIPASAINHRIHVQRSTYTPTRPAAASLTNTIAASVATPAIEPKFGDTAVPASGTTTIPVTGYSVMTGADRERQRHPGCRLYVHFRCGH